MTHHGFEVDFFVRDTDENSDRMNLIFLTFRNFKFYRIRGGKSFEIKLYLFCSAHYFSKITLLCSSCLKKIPKLPLYRQRDR